MLKVFGDSLSCGLGCASKRGKGSPDLRKQTPGLVDAPRPNGAPVDSSDEALAQSEALISLIETAISRRSDKLKEQGASEVAPGATNSIAGLIQPADVDRALRGNGTAGPSSRPPAAHGKPPAEGGYEYEYYDAAAPAPAAAGDEYEYSYTYTYREGATAAAKEGAPAAAQEDAVAQGLSPDEYEYARIRRKWWSSRWPRPWLVGLLGSGRGWPREAHESASEG